MRSSTQAVTIEAPASAVFAFVAEPTNLPRWAVGFAKDIRSNGDGDGWTVTTAHGAEVTVRWNCSADRGTIDFHMEPAPGLEAVAYARVVPNGDGADFVFTQQQPVGTDAEAFEALVAALSHELTVLKALLEVACPN